MGAGAASVLALVADFLRRQDTVEHIDRADPGSPPAASSDANFPASTPVERF